MNEASLLWSVLFGGFGIGYFSYGRKQKLIVPLLTGIALLVYPYFMPNITSLVIVGLLLVVLPYFVRL